MTTLKERLRDIDRRKADLMRVRNACDTEEIRLEGERLIAKMDDQMERLRDAMRETRGPAQKGRRHDRRSRKHDRLSSKGR